MQHQGTTYQLPAGYRFTLALSAALLAHILLFSGFPPVTDNSEHAPPSVQIELIAASHTSPQTSAQSTSELKSESNTEKPENPGIPQRPPKPGAQDIPQKPQQSSNQPVTHSQNTQDTSVSQAERAPSQAQEGEEQQTTIISKSPAETTPYLLELQLRIAKELEEVGGYKVSTLPEPVAIRIELSLLDNGTLTRAKIVKPTGNSRIDKAAYKATLAASPYPEPPAGNKEQNRFEVELEFAPKRF